MTTPAYAFDWIKPMSEKFDWETAFNIFAANGPLSVVADHFRRVMECPNSTFNDYGFYNNTDLSAHQDTSEGFEGFDKRAILIVLARSGYLFYYFNNDWTTKRTAERPPKEIMAQTMKDMDSINFIVKKTYDK